MQTTTTTTTFHFFTSGDLRGYKQSRDDSVARAYCPVHSGDNQKSLKIDLEGEYAGFGHCFNCHERVLIVDINPDAARRLGYDKDIPARHTPGVKPVPVQERWQSIEMQLLQSYVPHMRKALAYERPRAYLAQRGISFDVANEHGLMYLPTAPQKEHKGCFVDAQGKTCLMQRETLTTCTACRLTALYKWQDRILFPLASPDGIGFNGRTLALWQPGMDENEHRDKLKEHNKQMHDALDYLHEIVPYRKTNPAGYFNYDAVKTCQQLTIVEGPFDALALLTAGLSGVIALCGTSMDAKAIPTRIEQVMIALDGDDAGHKATKALRKDLWRHGIEVDYCSIPDDKRGKDWNERYRLHGVDGLLPLFATSNDAPPEEDDMTALPCAGCGLDLKTCDDVPFHFTPDGVLYCERCYPAPDAAIVTGGPQLQAVTIATNEGDYEQYRERVEHIASVFPGNCAIIADDPPGYTLEQHVRVLQVQRETRDKAAREATLSPHRVMAG